MGIIKPSRYYVGQSWGASWGHLGHTWGHLGIPSAIWEVWLHALKLTTLSALPIPMLRQISLEGVGGPETAFSLGTSSKKRARNDAQSK